MEKNREVLLRVENLCQFFKMGKYELKAVNNVSFNMYKGEVFGLVGESGCGKTTTGRAIIKLYDCTSGNVYFKDQRICAGVRSYNDAIKKARNELLTFTKENSNDEQAVSKKKEEVKNFIAEQRELIKSARFDHNNCDKMYVARLIEEINAEYDQKITQTSNIEQQKTLEAERKEKLRIAKRERLVNQIQMIFQDPIASLDPRMTVREIIAEGLIIKGIRDKAFIDERVYTMLEMVGLVREHADRYPHEFSGGQRQRIGVARSAIMQPDLIIADEPVSALDVSIQAQVINLLNDLRKDMGLTLMFIAHDLSVVKYFSNRIGVMYFGDLVELATSEDLFANPLHPYTKSLLSAIPLPDPVYEKRRKRILYNPLVEHDYSSDKPVMREIAPEHFVYCNSAEFEEYKKKYRPIK